MPPRIGITARTRHDGDRPAAQLNRAYVDAVAGAGGLPLVIPVLDESLTDAVLDSVDALVLSGGADIDPARYGQAAHPDVYGVDPARDAWELALVRAAIDRRTPLLAICRGQQVLAVACGGTLVQHLPAITHQAHRDADGSGSPVHAVHVDAHSTLARVIGAGALETNTSHHQAVDQPGASLRACAWAQDGTIEGIEPVEGSDEVPVLGVQWHPELLTTNPRHHALFRWIVGAGATG